MFMNDENKRNGQAIKIARETTNNQKDIFILRYTDILPIVEFLWFLGGPFSLKTHLQETLLYEPDKYCEQSNFGVNFSRIRRSRKQEFERVVEQVR